jgi:hypothetical protein
MYHVFRANTHSENVLYKVGIANNGKDEQYKKQ